VISLAVGIVLNLDGALRSTPDAAGPTVPSLVRAHPDVRPREIDVRQGIGGDASRDYFGPRMAERTHGFVFRSLCV